ncbi:hypothetical protein Tco_1408389 [Tanacetum coccineum]
MSITKEQQQALDDALVPREQRLWIGNCNYRLSTTFKPKEPTFQIALDVLSLTPFYQDFLISAKICSRFAQIFLELSSTNVSVVKLTNLNIKERLALGVSLRMFTRSIVIKRHVEDLQLGVKSYQKKLNLKKPDKYRSDLKQKTAYTAYSNPRGFIYQNQDKKNRLMCIDELHKFSDGTLNDVRSALDDTLIRIRMKYLPQTI